MTATAVTPVPEKRLDPSDFRISRIRALRGPNYWRLAPVIACDVKPGQFISIKSSQIDGFVDRLVSLIPSLRDHPCTKGRPGGFIERLREGTYLPHILEHVSLELQTLAGTDVGFGRVVPSGDEGIWWVIIGYEDEEVGIRSIEEAAHIIRACVRGDPFDICKTVEELRELRETVALGPSTRAIFD